MNWKWRPQWTVTSGMLMVALRKPSHFGGHAKWCCTVAVEVVQGLQLVLSIWSGSRLLQPIDFVLCSSLPWEVDTSLIIKSRAQLKNRLLHTIPKLSTSCWHLSASGFPRQFLRLSFQNPACLSSLARGVSSSGLNALCCTQKMTQHWTLGPTHYLKKMATVVCGF